MTTVTTVWLSRLAPLLVSPSAFWSQFKLSVPQHFPGCWLNELKLVASNIGCGFSLLRFPNKYSNGSFRESTGGRGFSWKRQLETAGRPELLHQQVDPSGWVASGSCCQGSHYALWLGWHLGIMACIACAEPIFLSLPLPSTLIISYFFFSYFSPYGFKSV